MNPPPSSLAPVCEPVSQESICPPISRISSGLVSPLISKTRLLELVLGTDSFSRTRWRVIFWPLSCIRWNISASSTVIAAIGIYWFCWMPAWTEQMEKEATDRTRAAAAPYLAALAAPLARYSTDSEYVVHFWLYTTIFPFTWSFFASSSSKLLTTITSARMFLNIEEMVPTDAPAEANQGQFLGGGSRGVHRELFFASHPFSEIADRLQSDVIEALFVRHGGHFLNDHLQHLRPPHPRAIGVRDVGQPLIGTMMELPRLILDGVLKKMNKIGVILLRLDHCQDQQEQQQHFYKHKCK